MQKLKFKSIFQFIKHFKDDETCRAHLESTLWNNIPICPHCKTISPYRLSDGKTFKCSNKECRKKFTVLTGTIFQQTYIPLPTWFYIIYVMTSHKKGISSIQISKDLGITQKSAWYVAHRIKKMLSNSDFDWFSNQIEMDETLMGGRSKGKDTRGRSTKHKVALIGIAQRGGKVKIWVVKDTSSKTIDKIINENVTPDATVISDAWVGYTNVKKNREHWVINHSDGQYAIGSIHTNTIEGVWSLLKRMILGTYHKVSLKHLQTYCNEFAFRYNTRTENEFDRFNLALLQSNTRLRYQDLIKN